VVGSKVSVLIYFYLLIRSVTSLLCIGSQDNISILEISYRFSGLRIHKIVLELIKYWQFHYAKDNFLIDPIYLSGFAMGWEIKTY
jgi:hypothetical protein